MIDDQVEELQLTATPVQLSFPLYLFPMVVELARVDGVLQYWLLHYLSITCSGVLPQMAKNTFQNWQKKFFWSFSASESVHFNVAAYCERRGRRVASLSFNLRLSSSMTWLLVIELNGQVMLSTRNCIFTFNKSLCKSRSAERDFSNSFFSSENWFLLNAHILPSFTCNLYFWSHNFFIGTSLKRILEGLRILSY